jgi:hypothetical protein
MASKIKRLTEEERQAELKAYSFGEGLQGFLGVNISSSDNVVLNTTDVVLNTTHEPDDMNEASGVVSQSTRVVLNTTRVVPETTPEGGGCCLSVNG